jgi:hypothetical protein
MIVILTSFSISGVMPAESSVSQNPSTHASRLSHFVLWLIIGFIVHVLIAFPISSRVFFNASFHPLANWVIV